MTEQARFEDAGVMDDPVVIEPHQIAARHIREVTQIRTGREFIPSIMCNNNCYYYDLRDKE